MSADYETPVSGEVPAAGEVLAPAPVKRRRRLGRRGKIGVLAGVVVVALVAGVIVWAPWNPGTPTSVRASSPDATSAAVSWRAADGGVFGTSSYRVLRDGKQVGTAPGSATSWTDHGLAPGTSYHYTVIAAGLGSSAPSAAMAVTTQAPAPVGLTSDPTHTTVSLHWSPPPNAPTPDRYIIMNSSNVIDNIAGTTTSYVDTQSVSTPGATYAYQVIAEWGPHQSVPSVAATGTTVNAPLTGSFPVVLTATEIPSDLLNPLPVGNRQNQSWSATASCTTNDCASMQLNVAMALIPKGQAFNLTLTMKKSGSGYSGTTHATTSGCGPTTTDQTPETDTITVTLKPRMISNGAWTTWSGTLTDYSPYIALGGGFCPAMTTGFDVAPS
jgi:hypothetical protein